MTARTLTTPAGLSVELTGQADLNALPLMQSALLSAAEATLAAPGRSGLTVDLCRVSYIDSAGLSALVAAAKALTPGARELRVLVTSGGQPDRALRLVRFDAIMAVICDTD